MYQSESNTRTASYDYDPENKTISVNEAETEVVRMIYDLYLQGYGTTILVLYPRSS